MVYTDYHVHSDVSNDCHATMWEMVQAEAAAGMDVICFTNHCDLLHAQDETPNDHCRAITGESVDKLREWANKCTYQQFSGIIWLFG